MRNVSVPFVLLATLAVSGGCATEERVAGGNICPEGLTYACTSSVGKIQRCICATREDLREILDPVNDY